MKKILIIVNPSSGDKKGKEFGQGVYKLYDEKNYDVTLYETTGNDNFSKLVRDALNEGLEYVVLIGGDGTVSEFTNQISSLKNRPDIILCPLGTTNNFARALNSELDTEKIITGIKKCALTENKVDVGQINDEYFISTVSIGTIPEVAWKTEDRLKEELGSLAYMVEGIKTLGEEANYFDLNINLDDEKIEEKDVFLVVIGLSNSVFGIPIFFKEARIDDGKLHLYLLKKGTISEITKSLANRITPNEKENDLEKQLSYTIPFTRAKFISNTDLNSSVDGEKGPTFPIELDVLPKHLTFYTVEKEGLLE